MLRKNKLLALSVLLLNVGASFGGSLDIQPPSQLPPPTEVTRHNIKIETGQTPPQLETPQTIQRNQNNQNNAPVLPPPPPPPIIVPEYEVDIKTNQFQIIMGQRIERESNKDKNTNTGVNVNPSQTNQILNQDTQTSIDKGYCVIDRNIELTLDPIYLHVKCLINNKSIETAQIELNPEPSRYMISGKVLKLNDKPVKSLAVMNADRTSFNLADDVDKRLISNILVSAASQTGRDVAQNVSNIFNNAARQTTTGYAGYSVTTVDPTSALDQIPKSAMYLALANLLRAGANVATQEYGGKLPTLFKIYKGKEIYIEVERERGQ